MMSPLIPLLSEEEALKRGRELGISDYIAKMNIFRVLLNHPRLAKELNSTIIALVSSDEQGNRGISDRMRELIIMRVSWKAHCNYEWSQHWLASLFFGLTEAELAAVRDWPHGTFKPEERAVLSATDELLDCGKISAQTWVQLRSFLKKDQAIIELVTCIGNWHMFALILNGLEVPLDNGMASWPPDGKGPD
jgi:alkylhydroperoxidase family enzyme